MTKHSVEKRIAAAKAVREGESIAGSARRYGMSKKGVSRDIRMIETHGEKVLARQNKNWTPEEKYQILKYMYDNELTCIETGIHFGIRGSSTVWGWERRYLEKGMKGLENKKKGRKRKTPRVQAPKTREEELLERIQYLEAENEYLKKLNALVAEREKQERKNK